MRSWWLALALGCAMQVTALHRLLWLLLACYLLLAGSLSFYEWYRVGVIASPEVLSQYPFGAEGPAAGDPAYANALAYARRALQTWLFAALVFAVLVLGARKRSAKVLFACYAVVLLAVGGRAAGAL